MKYIVATTINPPTEAIKLFDKMEDWQLIVVGDQKTPQDYKLENGLYLSPDDQVSYDRRLSDAIGWNCLQRRNIGLLIAYDAGAEVIALVDDDNIPYPDWGNNLMIGRDVEVDWYETLAPAFDPVGCVTENKLWHRGFPIQLLQQRNYSKSRLVVKRDIQADFWDGDPDIDAICRMEHAPDCKFNPDLFPLAGNQVSPFNSQNTFLSRDVIPHYFLFPSIGRMDDIWASYYCQAQGFRPVYGKASVKQVRNVHNLTSDFKQEYLGHVFSLNLIQELAVDPERIFGFVCGESANACKLFRRHFES